MKQASQNCCFEYSPKSTDFSKGVQFFRANLISIQSEFYCIFARLLRGNYDTYFYS